MIQFIFVYSITRLHSHGKQLQLPIDSTTGFTVNIFWLMVKTRESYSARFPTPTTAHFRGTSVFPPSFAVIKPLVF